MRYPGVVLGELPDRVTLSFFATITISLILLSICTLTPLPGLSLRLWMVGTASHLLLTFYVLAVWINHEPFEIHHMTPAWFMPVVGNILVPYIYRARFPAADH